MQKSEYQEKMFRHGELLFVPVDELPQGVEQIYTGKEFIVGHSETGHHHVAVGDVTAFTPLTEGTIFETVCRQIAGENRENWPLSLQPLQVNKDSQVKHLKTFDQHETLELFSGCYLVPSKTEFDPFAKLIQRVRD